MIRIPYNPRVIQNTEKQLVPIAFSKELLARGHKHSIGTNFQDNPHMVTTGATGSGKTFFNKFVISSISKCIKDSQVTVLDYKASDYSFAKNCNRLYEFDDVYKGLDAFYEEFQARLKGEDESRNFKMLVIEELGSIVSSLEKKQAEDFKMKVGKIVNLSREFNMHMLISTQRADSSYFNSGVRDSITVVVALGNISKEAKEMLFSEVKDKMTNYQTKGTGYLLVNGKLHEIVVPQIKNQASLEKNIIDALNR